MNVDALLQRHEKLKQRKQFWFPLYQQLAQYVMLRKQYFTTEQNEGPFLLNNVFDSTAPHAAHLMASSILGQIWPNPFESFEFVPQVAQSEAAFSDAFEMMLDVNEVLPVNLGVPEAGVMTAFHEAMMDAAVFGTGAICIVQTNNYKIPIRVKALDSKMMSFAENDNGDIDTVYIEKIFTAGGAVQRFGYESVSEQTRKLYDAGKLDEKVKVLHVIEPRRERNPIKLGTQDMPFASIWIEIGQKHLLQESGFNEMPIIVFRFWKNVNETEGRSPAMDALSDIRALNKLVDIFEKSGEMGLDPPKMISNEDVLGAGKVPWYPGAWIPVHNSGRLSNSNMKPVEPVITVQNPSWAQQRMIDLRENIKEYFMLNQLSDLSNTSRQTLGEAHIRNELRLFMTGPLLIRFLMELVSPFLDRSFNILLEMGFFGVVRGSVQDFKMQMLGIQPKYLSEDFISKRTSGLKGYRINFICPAARLMKLEEAQGLDRFADFVLGKLAPINPGVVKNLNFDEAARSAQRLFGASGKILRSPGEVEQMNQAEAQQQQEVAQLQQAQAGAMAFKDAATGVKQIATAG